VPEIGRLEAKKDPLIKAMVLTQNKCGVPAGEGRELKDLPMQEARRNVRRLLAIAALLPAIGACSTNISLDNVTFSKPEAQRKPDWTTYSGNKDEFGLRPVTAEDLVGPNGLCAAQPAAAAAGEPVLPPGTPTVQGGIALQMTECDVVRRAGLAEKVDLGTDEKGQRSALLTFTRGPHPGIYRFAAGRLVSIERAPTPAAPPPKQKTAPSLNKRPTGT
jgi:hypothetical protein